MELQQNFSLTHRAVAYSSNREFNDVMEEAMRKFSSGDQKAARRLLKKAIKLEVKLHKIGSDMELKSYKKFKSAKMAQGKNGTTGSS